MEFGGCMLDNRAMSERRQASNMSNLDKSIVLGTESNMLYGTSLQTHSYRK